MAGQLTRMLISFANDTITYYQFAKSSNARENGVYRRRLDERSLAGWRAVSRLQGYGAPFLLTLSMACVILYPLR